MQSLRRIPAGAQVRVLFRSYAASTSNTDALRLNAISRLNSGNFLRFDDRNLVRADYLCIQQRGLWTKEHVLEEKDKSAEDKDKKDKSGPGVFTILGAIAGTLFVMYTIETAADDASFVRTKIFDHDDSDANDSVKFGFGHSGEKPTKFEYLYWRMHEELVKEFEKTQKSRNEIEDSYRQLKKAFMESSGMSEEESEKMLVALFMIPGKSEKERSEAFYKMAEKNQKEMYFNMVTRRILSICFIPGLWMAVLTYIILTAYKRSLPSFPVFIQLFTVLPSLSYFGVRAYMKEKLKPYTQ